MSATEKNNHDPAVISKFTDCHGGILRKFDWLHQLPEFAETAEKARLQANQAIDFFREVIFEHHLDEERELFPTVLANAVKGAEYDNLKEIISVLTNEHREMEIQWKSLEKKLRDVAKGQDSSLALSDISDLESKYRAHAEFEESHFLPLCEEILGRSSDGLASLGLLLHIRHNPQKMTNLL